ncbi:Ankyrin repeat domain-containing protein 50 [Fusarium oxysporum f. sp. albedinis]|nr:Ankyrin repeat domain-containing protein 50 [Fusarium oxysporum f. sp. albedinis]
MTAMITDSSLQMILSGTVFVLTIYGAAIVWYRLFLHPLSKYPGPFWSWISAFPGYCYTLRQDWHTVHFRFSC